MFNSLKTSQIVNRWFDLISLQTLKMESGLREVFGRPIFLSSSMLLRPSLNFLNQKCTVERFKESPYTCFISLKHSVNNLFIRTLNFKITHCSNVNILPNKKFAYCYRQVFVQSSITRLSLNSPHPFWSHFVEEGCSYPGICLSARSGK